ncbi:MAG: hypothetical protein QNL12_05635 [Acidimicrobiia bacterium]|nr:hypothetical protein [Acidimicrobiia bacterium]MDX2466775.1 hypothetical protein [Acidimicrobiia bacterium]
MKKLQVHSISVEELLEAAGFDFTVVEQCPHPTCEVCTDHILAAAA